MSFALVIGFRLYLWPSDLSSFSIEMLHEYLFLFVGMTLLYLVGVCDDLVGVGYRYKFIVQVVSALLLVLSGNWLDTLGGLFGIYSVPALLGVPVTVFAVVYVTNAINLIDGIDGLASGFVLYRLIGLERVLFSFKINVFMPCSLSVRWESSCLSGATMSLAMPTAGISSSWAMLGV